MRGVPKTGAHFLARIPFGNMRGVPKTGAHFLARIPFGDTYR